MSSFVKPESVKIETYRDLCELLFEATDAEKFPKQKEFIQQTVTKNSNWLKELPAAETDETITLITTACNTKNDQIHVGHMPKPTYADTLNAYNDVRKLLQIPDGEPLKPYRLASLMACWDLKKPDVNNRFSLVVRAWLHAIEWIRVPEDGRNSIYAGRGRSLVVCCVKFVGEDHEDTFHQWVVINATENTLDA